MSNAPKNTLPRREMLVVSGLALGWAVSPWAHAFAADKPRRKVLFFTRSAGFQHDVIKRNGDELSHAEKAFTAMGKKHGFDVVCTKDGTVFDSDLSPYDAIFFYTTGDLTAKESKDGSLPMSAKGKQALLDAVKAGKGFMASHCGSDTFHSPGPSFEEQNPPDPYIAMVGGEFIRHGKQQEAKMAVASPKFPGLAGIGDSFRMTEEWYSLKNFPNDLHVILAQDTQGMEGNDYDRPPYPATWAHMHGKGRVFYTSMGHREDVWDNPVFQRILVGGLIWACGDAEADITPNIQKVCPGAHVLPKPPLAKPKPATPPATTPAK